MFTGIIETLGRIESLTPSSAGMRLVVAAPAPGWTPRSGRFELGDSICVSGVCLTLAAQQGNRLSFDVIPETLARSSLKGRPIGAAVNLESALTPTTAMGGHMVQGHVDGIGKVTRVTQGEQWRLAIQPPRDLMIYLAPKGSVAIEGVSLTLASVSAGEFEVALIPTTLNRTTLGELAVGAPVNLETDIVARQVVHWLRREQGAGTLTMQRLREAGF